MRYYQLHQPHNSWSNKPGLSIIDLSITLALITGIATMGIPVMLNLQQTYVGAQARALQTTCWALNNQAIAKDEKIKLTLNENAQTYSWDNHTDKLAPKVKFGIMPGAMGPPSDPKHRLTSAVTFAHNTIFFYPNGRITPGSVYLVDDHRQTLYAMTIPVARALYVRIYRYRDARWQLCT
jgi:hypothetical protein